jgi:UDP-galactopyranose mutase
VARFGSLRPAKTNGACNGNGVKDCCADGILEASARLGEKQSQTTAAQTAPADFEEFMYKVWGAGIAKHFAIPYNRKLWAVPLSEMETSWLGGRVPMPDLEEMIEGALVPAPKPMGPNARFGYPLRGGFQKLMDGWIPKLKGELPLNTSATRISPSKHTVTLSDGETIKYDSLIGTMPLPLLIRQIRKEAPADIHVAADSLRQVAVRCVHIGVGRENLTEKHWIYYPEDTVFHRIFVQGNASPHCNPPGGFGLTCEITYSPPKAASLRWRCPDRAMHSRRPQGRNLQSRGSYLGHHPVRHALRLSGLFHGRERR